MPQEPRKRRKKTKNSGLLLKVAAVLLFVYVAVNIFGLIFDKSLQTTVAVSGSVEDSIEAVGYIFKDITIVRPENSGFLESVAGEGEKVALGETVAVIYQSEGDYAQRKELQEVEEQISELEGETYYKETYASDTTRIEQNISREVRAFTDNIDRTPKNLSALKKNLDKLITKKLVSDGKLESDQKTKLSALYSRRDELSHSGISRGVEIAAPSAGMYSARVSAAEEELTPDRVKKLVPGEYDELDRSLAKRVDETLDGNVFKIVNDFKWYFVTVVDESAAQRVKVGQSVGLRFFDITDRAIEGEISYISGTANGRAVIAVMSEGYVDSIYSTPRASVEIVLNSYNGIMLPTESIRVVDGVRGVYIVKNGYSKFIEVDIIFSNKEKAIVSEGKSLSMYDNVIVKYPNIRDGMEVR